MSIKKKQLIIRIELLIIHLEGVLRYTPSKNNIILYQKQKKILIDNTVNKIKIIDNYINTLKKKYNLEKILNYPINNIHSLEQIIINIELIKLMYKFILNNVDILPQEIIKLSQLLDLYIKKIAVFVKYPSKGIYIQTAIWLPSLRY